MNPLLILLIDDDEDGFLITRGLLAQVKSACYQLKWVSTYETGLEELRHKRHDVCLLDYRLGARDGLELLHEAIAEGCLTPIIMLTGQGDHLIDIQAMNEGAADFLDKDRLDAARLERSVRYTVERQRLVNALRTSESRFRRLFDANIIGVFFAESSGRITDANDAFLKMLGYDQTDLPIQWNQQLKTTEGQFLDDSGLQQLRTAGVATPREHDFLHKDGKRVPVLIGAALLESHSDQYICFVVDMCERNRLRGLVNQNEKLAAIGMLSAGIAHEINNPLSFVANNLAVLRRDVVGLRDLMLLYDQLTGEFASRFPGVIARIEETRSALDWDYLEQNLGRMIESTQEGVQRITGIVQKLRAMASSDLTVTEDVALSALVETSLEVLHSRLVKTGIQVEVNHRPMPLCHGCASQIVQVFVNLLANAIDAIESAGGKERGVIRISSQQVGEHLIVEVVDNGCGIASEDLPHMFDPFFTRKPVGAGMGLGLALSHRIMADHGGRIAVESQPGMGSRFTIYLPIQASRDN